MLAELYLFREAYHFIESGESTPTDKTILPNIVNKFPYSFTNSGYISRGNGAMSEVNNGSSLWTNFAKNSTDARSSTIYIGAVWVAGTDGKKMGFSVHIVPKKVYWKRRTSSRQGSKPKMVQEVKKLVL